MNPLRTVGGRLSLALAFVVAGALLMAYLVVVPSLETRIVDARVNDLAKTVVSVASDVDNYQGTYEWQLVLPGIAERVDARVLVWQLDSRRPAALSARADSGTEAGLFSNDRVALQAALSGAVARGIVRHGGRRYAEAAMPLPAHGGHVVLLATPLEGELETVQLVERRILLAGLIALVIAVAVGNVAARMFARRIRRLERAADRIAAGQFDEPVVDTGRDELGQLAQAFERMRQRLAHLDDARREFIANASHELRTPLFSLGGMLELLDDEDLDDATRDEFLRSMRQQVQRLTKLATDLLDLTRLDAGRLHVEREPVELGALAEGLAEEFRALAQAREHRLSADGDAAALADDQRVLQIGRILVENAIIHTPPGTSIEIRVRRDDGAAVLEVVDAGPGIPDEHAGHVFERFYRVDGALTSGSGLGLAIASELAEVMGGEVDLRSRPGRTTFRLRLPSAARAEPAPTPA